MFAFVWLDLCLNYFNLCLDYLNIQQGVLFNKWSKLGPGSIDDKKAENRKWEHLHNRYPGLGILEDMVEQLWANVNQKQYYKLTKLSWAAWTENDAKISETWSLEKKSSMFSMKQLLGLSNALESRNVSNMNSILFSAGEERFQIKGRSVLLVSVSDWPFRHADNAYPRKTINSTQGR